MPKTKSTKKKNGIKQIYIVPTANLYIKALEMPADKNKPVLVRADIAENIVNNLKLARYAKTGEVKSLEEVAEPVSTTPEVKENAASD